MQAQWATPGTAAAYVAVLAHLALAQSRLQRDDEALATLTAAMDVLMSDPLHSALAALGASEEPRCALSFCVEGPLAENLPAEVGAAICSGAESSLLW